MIVIDFVTVVLVYYPDVTYLVGGIWYRSNVLREGNGIHDRQLSMRRTWQMTSERRTQKQNAEVRCTFDEF